VKLPFSSNPARWPLADGYIDSRLKELKSFPRRLGNQVIKRLIVASESPLLIVLIEKYYVLVTMLEKDKLNGYLYKPCPP
jgi:hypothetical protein